MATYEIAGFVGFSTATQIVINMYCDMITLPIAWQRLGKYVSSLNKDIVGNGVFCAVRDEAI
jgi:hypothetical protein